MRQESVVFTQNRADNVVKAIEEALTSFTGTEINASVQASFEFEADGSLFVDIEQDEAQIFVSSLRKRLLELVESQEFFKEGSEFADFIVGSTYALLLSISGRTDSATFTLDNAKRAAKVEHHMKPVRDRVHALLRVQ